MSQVDSTENANVGGVVVQAPKSDVYTLLLGVSLAAILLSIVCLLIELGRFDWDTKASGAQPGPLTLPSMTTNAPAGDDAVQPGGVQPGGVQPGGVQPGGVQPGGAQPGGVQPGGVQPGGAQPDGAQPGGAQPGGAQPGGAQPGGAQPGGAQPGGAQPGGAQPGT